MCRPKALDIVRAAGYARPRVARARRAIHGSARPHTPPVPRRHMSMPRNADEKDGSAATAAADVAEHEGGTTRCGVCLEVVDAASRTCPECDEPLTSSD